ncbi:hypothetical protein BEL04_21880 [Mucilaginibacter sp. PPCGB 2223]|uniref:TolC family protein n=1 Tax=Mucilaginibacter sp. PPCGB 2223 TaxID=1886027 RepID=UPI0008243718|nr:TolC family protein [Mucilaginibacter sp. PPCGB 2223]OCX50434.1 hypothetical protein BEL04_21880 [Mucilaginibacter sp. PPCGB 2223]
MNTFKLLLFACALSATAYGQRPGRVYLDSLLQTTARNYPLIKAKRLQSQSLQQAVQLQKNGVIPMLTASYQADYATYNNITGMIYPQYIIPISGPPSKTNVSSAVPGSAAALSLLWDPFTFGQRQTAIDLAQSRAEGGKAEENLTVFRQQLAVINAWLDYSLDLSLIRVFQQNIDREAYHLKQAQSLASSGLRPGTDSSTFHAELIRARIQMLAFEQRRDSTLSVLKELAGGQLPPGLPADSSIFGHLPIGMARQSAAEHPEISLQNTLVKTDELTLSASKKSLLPKLSFWGTTYARGSGVAADGSVNSSDGWQFQRYNYGIGLQLSVPILEAFRQKPLFKQQRLAVDADREILNQTELRLQTQVEISNSALEKAIAAAKLSPEELHAARYAYDAMLSRYQAGLTNYDDAMQSLLLLYRAEASVKMSYWAAWKALLGKAAYEGSLDVFLNPYGK